jgi:hypothetical protein
MSFEFTNSTRCLVHLSIAVREGPYRCEVDGDACSPLVDEDCAPMDMTFSAMRFFRISSMDFSTALKSPDINTQDMISWVGEQLIKVEEWMPRSQ